MGWATLLGSADFPSAGSPTSRRQGGRPALGGSTGCGRPPVGNRRYGRLEICATDGRRSRRLSRSLLSKSSGPPSGLGRSISRSERASCRCLPAPHERGSQQPHSKTLPRELSVQGGRPHRVCSAPPHRWMKCGACSGCPVLTLTPPLSPREREKRVQRWLAADASAPARRKACDSLSSGRGSGWGRRHGWQRPPEECPGLRGHASFALGHSFVLRPLAFVIQFPVFNSTTSCGPASRWPAGLTRM